MVGQVFAVVVAIAGGPPALPPLPGEQPPAEEEPTRPSPKEASKPKTATPKKATPKKATPKAADPEPAPQPEATAESDATAEPTAPAEGDAPPEGDASWSVPQLDEPPQPDATGAPDSGEAAPPAEGDGAAAPMASPELPGEEPPAFRLPPPERPPYGGTGLFIGAATTFVIALTEQIVAHVLVKRRCIDPIGRGEIEDTADFGKIFSQCAPGVLPALALRVHSDLGLLATIGLVAGGGALRGQRDAWDDVFGKAKPRKIAGLRWGGVALIGIGIVTWFSTGAGAWGMLGKCRTSRCANAARALSFSMRDVSAIMVASGAGMLAYAEAHRRHSSHYQREKLMTVQPMIGFGFGGLSLSGSF